MNGPLKFLTARKILPLLDLLAKFKRVLACSCSPNFCVARKLAKQIFYFCLCSQKSRSARHARECSKRPFVTPNIIITIYCLDSCKSCFVGFFTQPLVTAYRWSMCACPDLTQTTQPMHITTKQRWLNVVVL